MLISAAFSPDRAHRYTWTCEVDRPRPDAYGRVLFILLNPSTADELGPDPTIRRCIGYARAWGFGRLEIRNLFSYRSTDPRALYKADAPEGDPKNLDGLVVAAARAGRSVCGWGVHGALRGRGATVAAALRQVTALFHLGLTKDGHPRHPLYLRGDIQPTLWRGT